MKALFEERASLLFGPLVHFVITYKFLDFLCKQATEVSRRAARILAFRRIAC